MLSASGSAAVADPGFTVSLLSSTGALLATTTTDTSGDYAFTGLYAGSYVVSFPVPAGKTLSAGGAASPVTGRTAVLTAAIGQDITLNPETVIPPGASLTGAVIASAGGSGGSGLAGVSVDVLNAAGAVIATTTTNNGGVFLFTGLASGTYTIQYAPPPLYTLEAGGTADPDSGQAAAVSLAAGQALALPDEQVLTAPATVTGTVTFLGGSYWKMTGMAVSLLSTTGAVLATTVTDNTGTYQFTGVAAGSYQFLYTLPTGAVFYSGYENHTTGLSLVTAVAAGQSLTASGVGVEAAVFQIVSGTVLYQAGGAQAVAQAGVTVSLVNASGAVLTSVVTSAAGSFQIKGILPGSYQLSYAAPAGDILLSGPANAASGLTDPFTAVAGVSVSMAAETLGPAVSTASIAGAVTYDGAAEAAVAVTLLDPAGDTLATTYTDGTGAFRFSGLSAGSYQIEYDAPVLQVLGAGPASSTTGLTAVQTLKAGQALTLASEALADAPAAVTGTITYAGAAASGAGVTLLNADGTAAGATTASAAGRFTFTGLAAGLYEVHYTLRSGQAYGAGPADSTTGTTSAQALAPGEALTLGVEALLPTLGTVTGAVTYAEQADPGVVVTLLNAAGVAVASTKTGSGGAFTFSSLNPGTYQLEYSDTALQVYASGPAGSTGLDRAIPPGGEPDL